MAEALQHKEQGWQERLKAWTDNNLKGDPVIWAVVLVLALCSILVVYSATGTLAYKMQKGNEHYLLKHAGYMLLCLGAMWVCHRIDYRYYAKISWFALLASIPLLIITRVMGQTINDASRWLTIPFINQSFQPSDLAKFALISSLAYMLSRKQDNIKDIQSTLMPMLLWCGLICGLIALSNFSTAVMLFATCMLLLFIGRVPVKYLMILAVVGVLFVTMGLYSGQRLGTVQSRVSKFMSSDPRDIPFQAQQSYIAISLGGAMGKGPGNSTQKNILPHPYSDFIYAIIVEEYGLVGGVFILMLYLVLLYRGMRAVANSNKAFGGLLSAGLTFSLVVQAMINMGVAVGLGPVTGLPLPLLSMGGTSLLFTGISLGIILSVSRGEVDEEFGTLNTAHEN